MNAYIDYDSKNFQDFSETVKILDEDGIKTIVVSSEPLDLTNHEFIKGDIVAILNGRRESHTLYVSSPLSAGISLKKDCEIQCFSKSSKQPKDLIASLENIEHRAKVARLFDSKQIYDCSVVCASELFWEKVFRIHVRWFRHREVVKKEFYHDFLINFCISLYDYKVELIKAESEL
jgi:hypothetical protein